MPKDIINLLVIFSLVLFTSIGSAFAYNRQQENLAVLEAQAEVAARVDGQIAEEVVAATPVTQEAEEVMIEIVSTEPARVVESVPDTSIEDAKAAAAEKARLAAVEAERRRQAALAQAEADAAAMAQAEAIAQAQADAEAKAEAEALAQAQAEAEAAALAKEKSRKSRAS
jgi:hypothetical protein